MSLYHLPRQARAFATSVPRWAMDSTSPSTYTRKTPRYPRQGPTSTPPRPTPLHFKPNPAAYDNLLDHRRTKRDPSPLDSLLDRRQNKDEIFPRETSVIPSKTFMSLHSHKKDKAVDPVYVVPPLQDPTLHLLSSLLMRHGKRAASDRRVSSMLLQIASMSRSSPLDIVKTALAKVAPVCRVLSHKSPAGKVVAKPTPLSDKQSRRKAFMWILKASEKQNGVNVEDRLAREFLAVIRGDSAAIAERQKVHEYAMINRANVAKTRTTL
ncbi:ribosomal protein S7 domain-containing protein [Flagelloscypha sp. PMI_526]|nr:ribosomal protein S7 domain-containing protein [Flagelloscypha sp. PMI_526]